MAENEDDLIIHGPKSKWYRERKSLGTILLEKMRGFSTRITHVNFVDGSFETYESFCKRSIRVAEGVRAHGLQIGDIVCICARNRADTFVTAIGAILAGTPVNVMDVGLSKADFTHMLRLLEPKMLFCEEAVLDIMQNIVTELQIKCSIIVYSESRNDAMTLQDFQVDNSSDKTFKAAEFSDTTKATAIVVCSSGTTGSPKGVMISHNTLLMQMSNVFEMTSNKEVSIIFTTLYWISGWLTFLIGLYTGVKRLYGPVIFTEKLALEAIQKYKATQTIFSPSILNRLVKYPEFSNYDLTSLKIVMLGGGLIAPQPLAELRRLLPSCDAIVGYGMTEFSGVISKTEGEEKERERSVGRLINGNSLKVIDSSTGEILGRNMEGEICIKSDYVMLGYYNNPEMTSNTIDEEGWFRTGDIGFYNEDDTLFITDRAKEVLKYQNWPICPADVEAVVLSHPDVVECGIVGVPHDVFGDILVAFVVLNVGSRLVEQDLKDYVAERVSDAQKIRGGIFFVKNIPMLPSCKVNRTYLKKTAFEMKDLILSNYN